jgi:hypothetical protein
MRRTLLLLGCLFWSACSFDASGVANPDDDDSATIDVDAAPDDDPGPGPHRPDAGVADEPDAAPVPEDPPDAAPEPPDTDDGHGGGGGPGPH